MITGFFMGASLILAAGIWTFIVFIAGFMVCARDAEKRLKGREKIDEFWSERGMK